MNAANLGADAKPDKPCTYPAPPWGWCCFHCGEIFTTQGAARDHFGGDIDSEPGCLMRVRLGDERGWLMEIRKLEAERDNLLRERSEEDTELHRELRAKDGELTTAVRRAEEQGYARGLEDAKKYPETLGLTRAALDKEGSATCSQDSSP